MTAKTAGELAAAGLRRHASTGVVVDVKTEVDHKMHELLSKRKEEAEGSGTVIETSSTNPVTIGLQRVSLKQGLAPGTLSAAQEWEARKANQREQEALLAEEAAAKAAAEAEAEAAREAAEAAARAEAEAAKAAAEAEAKAAKEAAEAALKEASAARVRHSATGAVIDINTERDEEMFNILEKQKRSSFRSGGDGAEGATRTVRAVTTEDMETDVRSWLATVLGADAVPAEADIHTALSDGVLLCNLARALAPGEPPCPPP